MSPTDNQTRAATSEPVGPPLTLKDVAALLVKHYGLSEGKFDLMIEYQLGGGFIGPTPDQRMPGMMVGVSKLGLTKAVADGPLTVDAAKVNPRKRKRAKA